MNDFNKLHKINQGQIKHVGNSIRQSELSEKQQNEKSQSQGIDTSIAMSHALKNFDDFDFDEEEKVENLNDDEDEKGTSKSKPNDSNVLI